LTTPSTISEWEYPGKVLFIDEKFDDVKDYMSELIKGGVSVQYWDAKSPFTAPMTNIRVVVLDLDLTGSGLIQTDVYSYYPAAEALSKINGPYLLIILSTTYNDKDPEILKVAYQDLTGTPLSGFVDGKTGLTKGASYQEIYDIIKAIIEKKEIFKMILTWEKILDKAKDQSLAKFTREKFDNEIYSFIKSIAKDVSEESLTREVIMNLLRLVSRYVDEGPDFNKLTTILRTIISMSPSPPLDSLLPHLRMYYIPKTNEKIWAGDIYRNEHASEILGLEYHHKYEMVMTPVCDLVQNKADTILLCEGFIFDYQSLCKLDHPIYKISEDLKIFRLSNKFTEASDDTTRKDRVFKNLKEALKKLPRLYTVWNFREKEDGEFVGLCIDFQNLRTITKSELEARNNKRVCRLDSPFIEDILQRFGTYSTRLGVPDVNSPS